MGWDLLSTAIVAELSGLNFKFSITASICFAFSRVVYNAQVTWALSSFASLHKSASIKKYISGVSAKAAGKNFIALICVDFLRLARNRN